MDIAHSFHSEVLRVNADTVALNTTKNLLTRKLTTRTSLKLTTSHLIVNV
jgi:hypothetical protein